MKRILDQIENGRDFIIELQKGLTRIPAIAPENGGEGEYDKFIWLKNYIKDWGFDKTEEILVPDLRIASGVRPTLITTINGICSEKTLWLITHLDVVPVGEIALWDTEPFEAVVDGDKIFGRGTEDNQQSLVSALLAAKTLLDNRIKPHYDVKLVFVADEEVGSGYGIDWILKNRADLFKKYDLIITPDVGDPDVGLQGHEIAVHQLLDSGGGPDNPCGGGGVVGADKDADPAGSGAGDDGWVD
ncbi:MAG TPA: M20/M25/M40 family metallo-hydrolase, partial [Spirochaetota bacterium]|nr:M20/M25/M40 family metallo-hydrolase [Spirochaetota bacterium]